MYDTYRVYFNLFSFWLIHVECNVARNWTNSCPVDFIFQRLAKHCYNVSRVCCLFWITIWSTTWPTSRPAPFRCFQWNFIKISWTIFVTTFCHSPSVSVSSLKYLNTVVDEKYIHRDDIKCKCSERSHCDTFGVVIICNITLVLCKYCGTYFTSSQK